MTHQGAHKCEKYRLHLKMDKIRYHIAIKDLQIGLTPKDIHADISGGDSIFINSIKVGR